MKNMKQTVKVIMVIIILILPVKILAFQDIDYEKMERDLNIMGKIIDTILEDEMESTVKISGGTTRGVYLEGYGVVFMTPVSSSYTLVYDGNYFRKERRDRDEEKRDEERDEKAINDKLKERLTDFMANYTDAIKQVSNSDMITLFINGPRHFGNYYSTGLSSRYRRIEETGRLKPFIMSVQKSDVVNYKRGSLSLNKFKNKVQYSIFGEDDEEKDPKIAEDIKIFKTILETSLEEEYGVNLSSNNIQGAYLDNFGVIFQTNLNHMNVRTGFNAREMIIELDNRKNIITRTIPDKRDRKRVDEEEYYEEMLDNLKNVLCETVADFGHTLRGLKNNEKVYIFINSEDGSLKGLLKGYRSFRAHDFNTNFMMMVRKGYINDYRNGSINLKEFKEKVAFKEF